MGTTRRERKIYFNIPVIWHWNSDWLVSFGSNNRKCWMAFCILYGGSSVNIVCDSMVLHGVRFAQYTSKNIGCRERISTKQNSQLDYTAKGINFEQKRIQLLNGHNLSLCRLFVLFFRQYRFGRQCFVVTALYGVCTSSQLLHQNI